MAREYGVAFGQEWNYPAVVPAEVFEKAVEKMKQRGWYFKKLTHADDSRIDKGEFRLQKYEFKGGKLTRSYAVQAFTSDQAGKNIRGYIITARDSMDLRGGVEY